MGPESILDPTLRELLDAQLDARSCGNDKALIDRVKHRVLATVSAGGIRSRRTVLKNEGQWKAILPGISRKFLWSNGPAQTYLIRFDPGAQVPAHIHVLDEECVLLEGTLQIGPDVYLQTGDCHVGRKGSSHGVTRSDTGTLVFVRGGCDVVEV